MPPSSLQLLTLCCKTLLNEEEKNFLESALKEIGKEAQDTNNKWLDFLHLSAAHGVLPLVYKCVEKHAKHLISEDNYNSLKSYHMGIVGRNMLMSAELLRVIALLEANGIKALPFKGPILAQIAYGDITLRQYSDLDFLIQKKHLYKAIEVLKEREYTPFFEMTPAQYKSYTSISHDYSLTSPKSNILIELHWRLLSNEFMVDIDEMDFYSDTSEITFQGKTVNVFQPELLFVYLAAHGAKHQWERLGWLLDIVKLIESQSYDWDKILEISKKTESLTITVTTLLLCQSIFSTAIPSNLEALSKKKEFYRKAKSMEALFLGNFEKLHNKNIKTKTISLAQLQQLTGVRNKFLFLTSVFKPTPLDFQSTKFPEKLTFLYYFSRPINVIRRWKDKFRH